MANAIQPSVTVYFASFAALLGALGMGLALGFTSPALPDMQAEGIFPKGSIKESFIGSTLAIGAFVGGMLGEPCNKLFGRRLSLILLGLPAILGWLLIALANGFTMIILGRLLTGLACGLVSGTAPTYVVEIAPPQIRGFLGSCFQVMVTIGILLAPVFGLFMNWHALAGVSILASIFMSGLMVIMPETPQWLLGKGRNEEAEFSLKKLRASKINDEFSQMSQTAQQATNGPEQYSKEILTSRELSKPLVFALALMFFQQFSGVNAVLFYQTEIFRRVSPGQDTRTYLIYSIYVLIAQVVATVLGSVLVDRLGRRILLLISGLGHTISLAIFGLYTHISYTDQQFQTDYAWIPLVSLIAFISAFSVGYGPIPWMMIPELSSARVRSMVASISTAFNYVCVFIVTMFVKNLFELIGDDYTYWLFAIICFLSCIFVGLSLPETKGRSSEQIQREMFGRDVQTTDPERSNDGNMNAMA